MKDKKQYSITALLPDGVEFIFQIAAYGISWIPTEAAKQLRINYPDTYFQAEIIRIEKV